MSKPLDNLEKYQTGPKATVREKSRFFLSMGFTMLVNAEPGPETEESYDRVHLSIGTNDCEAWKELAGKRVRNLYKYGLYPSEDKQRKDKFGHKCEICAREFGGTVTEVVDHEHSLERHFPNYVRGQLCLQCNIGLGMFKDKPHLLKAAALYIEGHIDKKTLADEWPVEP